MRPSSGITIKLLTARPIPNVRCFVWPVAHPRAGEIGEVPPLGSVSVTCSATRLRTMEAALIHALYMLDGQLAKGEFARVLNI